MSETPIQNTPAIPAGAEVDVLSSDASNGRTRGGDFDQNQLSFARGPEVPASSGSVSAYGVSGREQERAKPVDANHLEGSNKGDHRAHPGDVAAASVAKAADNGGPRQPVGQSAFRRGQ